MKKNWYIFWELKAISVFKSKEKLWLLIIVVKITVTLIGTAMFVKKYFDILKVHTIYCYYKFKTFSIV